MAKGGNKGGAWGSSAGVRVEHAKDYEAAKDPDIRGAAKGRREAGEYRDSRDARKGR